MKTYISIVLFVSFFSLAQNDTITVDAAWKKSGNVALVFNQANFSNWVLGGEDNLSLTLLADYTLNYNKAKTNWDTTFLLDYGLSKNNSSSFYKKTSDRFEVQSLLSYHFAKLWSYSFLFGFKTPFTQSYSYSTDAKGAEIRTKKAAFLSPAYLQLGLGLRWKETDNLWVNIAPVSPRLTLVNKTFTESLGDGEQYFGVDKNKTSRLELGFAIHAYWLANLFENVSLEQRLGLFSNYLDKPENVDIDYQATIDMTVNKHISANIVVQLLYDDNAIKRVQVRELFGVGVTVKL